MTALPIGPFAFGPADGTLRLHVYKDGPAARLGHDLDLVVRHWSAEGVVDEPVGGSMVRLVADLRSVEVEAGHGGPIPLSERDRKQIIGNLASTLSVERHPEVVVEARSVTAAGEGVRVAAEATIAGVAAPVEVEVVAIDAGVQVRATVVQTRHRIKPYRAPLGALKVKDGVGVTLEVRLAP